MHGYRPGGPPDQKKKKQSVYRGSSDTQSGGRQNYRRPTPPRRPAPPPRSDVVSGGRGDYRATPPDKTLSHLGINKTVPEFNQALGQVHSLFTDAYGRPPSPGLAFDILRAPIEPHELPQMFSLPESTLTAQANANKLTYLKNNPQPVFYHRPDGMLDLHSPFNDFLAQQTNKYESLTPAERSDQVRRDEPTLSERTLRKKYPWVSVSSMGLPLDPTTVFTAIQTIAGTKLSDKQAQVLQAGGETLQHFTQRAELAQTGRGIPGENTQPGAILGKSAQGFERRQTKFLSVANSVKTVKQAQNLYKATYPGWFNDLSSDGNFNRSWANRVVQLQKTAQFAKSATEQQAAQEGLSVPDYIQAWHNKQDILKKHPVYYQMVHALPLRYLVHPHSMTGSSTDFFKGLTAGVGTHWYDIVAPIVPAVQVGANAAGLGMTVLGGATDQYKAWGEAMGIALHHAHSLWTSNKATKEQLHKKLTDALIADPSWQRVVGSLVTGDPKSGDKGFLRYTDGLTNVLGDFVLWGKAGPGYGVTLERAPQNLARVLGNKVFMGATDASYRELLNYGKDGIYHAAEHLGGGDGAERLATATASDVKAGKMTLEEYRRLAAEAYTNHFPEYNGIGINSRLLDGMSHEKLPSGPLQARHIRASVRRVADNLDSAPGVAGNALGSFVNGVRSEIAHAVKSGSLHHYYEPKLPQRLYDWTASTFKDRSLAKKWSSELSRLRAAEDNPGIQDLEQRVHDYYHKEFPNPTGKPPLEDVFNPTFLTEQPSRFRFPSGGEKEATNPAQHLANSLHHVNRTLNDLGRKLRKIVVSGEPIPGVPLPPLGATLFEKHAIADAARALNAGMVPLRGRGAIADAEKEIGGLLGKTPALRRQYDLWLTRSELGEQRYVLGQSVVDAKNFNTGEVLTEYSGKFNGARRRAFMLAAARHQRNMLEDDALGALTASTPDDLRPLEQYLNAHPNYRRIAFGNAPKQVEEDWGPNWFTTGEPPGAKTGIHPAIGLQAKAMYKRYQEFVKAGQEAGIADPVAEAKASYATVRAAHKDKAFAKWIEDNKISFDVNAGLVERVKWGDGLTDRWVGTLMSPNKLYRRTLAESVTRKLYADMAHAAPGAPKEELLRTAMGTAEAVVKFHMLDLSNMLKVEQDFRHISWFATKHRLFWKYILGIGFREPKYYVLAHEIQKHLDSNGNINSSLFGVNFAIPIPRLTWINSHEQPDVSSPVEAAAGLIGGIAHGETSPQKLLGRAFSNAGHTGGSILTRDDQTWLTLLKMAHMPKSFEGATLGMTDRQSKQFNRISNIFLARNPHASDQDAIKYALHEYAWRSLLQSNTAIPSFLSYDPKSLNSTQELWLKFGDQKSGAAKRNFLEKHPQLQAEIGQSKDPKVYHHMLVVQPQMNRITNTLDGQMHQIQEDYLASGKWTPALERAFRNAHKTYSQDLQQLLLTDAQTWNGSSTAPKGVVREGKIITYGPLGQRLEGNPFQARQILHKQFKSMSAKELDKHTFGEVQATLQSEIDNIKYLQKKGVYTKAAAQDKLAKLYEKMSPFFSYPTRAPDKFHEAYYKLVDSYRSKRDAWRAEIKNVTQGQFKDRAYEELRAFTDAQDHPVKVTIGGKTVVFPSPVRIGFATGPEQNRQQQKEEWLSDNWNHLPRYAKEHLGRPVSEKVTKGWLAYTLFFSALQHDDKHAIKRLEKQFNITDVKALPIGVEIRKQGKYDYHKVIAKWLDSELGAKGAFLRDYNFSHQPKLKQLQQIPGVSQSPRFEHMLSVANDFLHKRGYINAPAHVRDETWRRYDGAELERWFKAQPKWFQSGLGPDFVNKLVSSG